MDTTKMTSLEKRVHGRNLINRLTVDNLKKVLPQLEAYKGKKVVLANGDFSKAFKIELPTFTTDDGQRMRIYLKPVYGKSVLFPDGRNMNDMLDDPFLWAEFMKENFK